MQEISDILSPGKKLSTDGTFCRQGVDAEALSKGRSRATLSYGFSPRTGPPFAGSHHRLAMTEGGGVIAPQCLANADTCPSSACHCEPVQDGNRGAPVRPGEGDAAE